MQSLVYQELDKKTDNEARTRLQSELPEMRAVLKRLREGSRSEFACFKKVRTRDRGALNQGQRRDSAASGRSAATSVSQTQSSGQMI